MSDFGQNVQRPHRSWRISTLIIALFSAFTGGIVLVMSLVTYSYSYSALEARTLEDNSVIISQAAASVGRYIRAIEQASDFIETNREIRLYLEDPTGENAGLYRTRFSSFLNYLPQINDDVESIFIFNKDGEIVYSPSNLQMKEHYDITQDAWYKAIASDNSSAPHLIGTSVRTMTRSRNPWVLAIARNILNERTGEIIGAQLVELNYSVLDDILSALNMSGGSYVFIVDSTGRMIYHPQLQLVNFGLKDENERKAIEAVGTVVDADDGKLYTAAYIPGTDYTMVGVTRRLSIVSVSQQMLALYLFLTVLMAFAGYIGAVWLARYITRPVERMEEAAEKIRNGALGTQFDGQGTVETEHMAESLDLMLETITGLMEQNAKDQETIRVSEIRALQSQINPHFLYNTLDTIVWMAEESGAVRIRELTMALATYFRVVLSSGRDMITVREEMSHVESYLFVQKTRYEMLDYSVETDADAMGLYMPKLLVQPVVENAIYHGIRDKGTRGTIRVRACREDDRLVITVSDNGRGMRERELKNIYQEKPKKTPNKGGGVGLRNIRERIRLYFGKGYGLFIRSEFRRGTIVRMELPALVEPGEGVRE